MPIHTTPIDFPIQDATTLRFVGHCTQHWNNFALCSDAHVAFMKHLACYIFNLPAATQLIGILFEDSTLVLMRPDDAMTFYAISRLGAEQFSACVVVTQDFAPSWGMGTGFWDGLHMAESQLMTGESAGPTEDEQG